jgi:alpha-L-fucosidase
MFNEKNRKPLTEADVRFTTKAQHLYAFVMGWPAKQATIAALGTTSNHAPGKIENVELLGFPSKLHWTRNESGLHIQMPEQRSSDHAIAFKIDGDGLV